MAGSDRVPPVEIRSEPWSAHFFNESEWPAPLSACSSTPKEALDRAAAFIDGPVPKGWDKAAERLTGEGDPKRYHFVSAKANIQSVFLRTIKYSVRQTYGLPGEEALWRVSAPHVELRWKKAR